MIIAIKFLLLINLGFIAFQDFKERQVLWFFFPTSALFFALLHYTQAISWKIFLYEVITNWLLITCIISILYVYTKLISKKKFMGHSIGLGDILFFYAFGTGFQTVTFIVLLACSILFSLFTFLILKNRLKLKTVPLAGFMGLFLMVVLAMGEVFNTGLNYGY